MEGRGGEEEKGRRDLASSSGRVAAFNEVQMSLSWQQRAACAGGERGAGRRSRNTLKGN